MRKPPNNPASQSRHAQAFTLFELALVTACVFFLAVLILPASAGSKTKAFQCLQNQKQIMAAMMMYAQDFNDLLPANPDDGNTVPGHNWCADRSELYDPNILIRNCVLIPYLYTNATPFRCTADQTSYVSPTNPQVRRPAIRSISMSHAVGTICLGFDRSSGHSGKPNLPVNGPWLDNSHSHRANLPYRTYGKTSDMVAPTPASLWVILEEHPASLNDASFAFGMNAAEWIDFPSTIHEFGCVFAFGDGHTELRKWTDPRTKSTQVVRTPVPGSLDWRWMADRTTARAQ
jgi:type II secretory pathway pseudopilin PulG